MKFKTSTLALSATLAAGLASSAFADTTPTTTPTPTPYANLAFKTNQTYTVTVNGTTQTPSNGAWSGSQVVVENSAIVIDSDSTEPLTFTPNEITDEAKKACDATELDFNVEASFVPATVEQLAKVQGARCGFAIKLDGDPVATNYWLYNGSQWTQSSSAVDLESGEMFNLKVRLDLRSDVKKATYFVKGVNIGETTLAATTPVAAIDFVGNGSLSALRGDRLAIISEVITAAGDHVVTVPEATMNAIRALSTQSGTVDPATYLANTDPGSVTGLNNLERIVLTGKVAEPPAANKPKIVAKAFPTTAGKLAIELDNLAEQLPQIDGATPRFELRGSNDLNGWTVILVNETGKFELDPAETETAYKFYRVKASVVYPTK